MIPLYRRSNKPGRAGHSLLNRTEIWLLELRITRPLDNTELLARMEVTGPPRSSRTASIPSSKLAFSTCIKSRIRSECMPWYSTLTWLHLCRYLLESAQLKVCFGSMSVGPEFGSEYQDSLIGFCACVPEISILTSVVCSSVLVWSVELSSRIRANTDTDTHTDMFTNCCEISTGATQVKKKKMLVCKHSFT